MNIKDVPITTIDLSVEGDYTIKYEVLLDKSKEDVIEAYRNNEASRTFTLPIYTKSIEEVPDFSDVVVDGDSIVVVERLYHAVNPWYVGNVEPIETAISELERILFHQHTFTERTNECLAI